MLTPGNAPGNAAALAGAGRRNALLGCGRGRAGAKQGRVILGVGWKWGGTCQQGGHPEARQDVRLWQVLAAQLGFLPRALAPLG